MKQFLLRHLIALYCILNIILTLLIVILYSLDEVPQQWTPAIIVISIAYLLKGNVGLKKLFFKMAFRKTYIKWYILAFIIPLVICGASFSILSLIRYQEIVFPTFNHSLDSYLLFLFFIVLGSIGEEIGWRGFLLPLLLRKHSYLVSSILIGVFWGAWHLQFQAGVSVFFVYILLTIEMSIVISWLCKMTNGNIISAIIMHSSFNLCALLLFEEIVVNISQNSELIETLYVSLVGLFLPLCIYTAIQMRKDVNSKKNHEKIN